MQNYGEKGCLRRL